MRGQGEKGNEGISPSDCDKREGKPGEKISEKSVIDGTVLGTIHPDDSGKDPNKRSSDSDPEKSSEKRPSPQRNSSGGTNVVSPTKTAGFKPMGSSECEPMESGSDAEPQFGCKDCMHEIMDTSGNIGGTTRELRHVHRHGIEVNFSRKPIFTKWILNC